MDSAKENLARPGSVKCAVVILVITSVIGGLVVASHGRSGRVIEFVIRWLVVCVFSGLTLVPVWFAYRGKGWGRWVILALQVLALFYFERGLRRVQARGEFEVWLYWAQALVELFATVLLFLPSSNRWYKQQRSASLVPPVIPVG